jgi:UDP-2,3-diacylglucosamine hydrolase
MGKVYFASDFHLGIPNAIRSLEREKKLVSWLHMAAQDAERIYLVGDTFDFWFEYKHAVPRGYTRLLGTLSELTDAGVHIEVFTGNHDMWMFDYLEKECGVTIHRQPIRVTHQSKTLYIGHGDGLGPGDKGYKFLKRFFSNPFCQWLFARLHPNLGIGLANYWSRKSRAASGFKDTFKGEDQEWLLQFCRSYILEDPSINYFIFGHRHLLLDFKIGNHSRYINLGDWFTQCNYAVMEDGELRLEVHK